MTRGVQYPCLRPGTAHCKSIHVAAPNVDVAARLALSHHIESRPTPPPAGTWFGFVVITPPLHDPNVPPRPRRRGRDVVQNTVEAAYARWVLFERRRRLMDDSAHYLGRNRSYEGVPGTAARVAQRF